MNFRRPSKRADMARACHLNEDMVMIMIFLSQPAYMWSKPRGFDFILSHAQAQEWLILLEAYGRGDRNTSKGLKWAQGERFIKSDK